MKQREIKFRFWDKDLNKMCFRHPSKMDFSHPNIISMQFIGLTDKNGVEIYEGDYLVDRYKDDGKWEESLLEVQWCPKNLQWAVDASFKQDGSFLTNLVDYFTFNELEVKGNVFENPKNKGE